MSLLHLATQTYSTSSLRCQMYFTNSNLVLSKVKHCTGLYLDWHIFGFCTLISANWVSLIQESCSTIIISSRKIPCTLYVMAYGLLTINHNLQISQSYICIVLYNGIENKLMNQSLLLSVHVYLQLKITRSYISTIPATSMHYRTVPQTFRHNSGTIVHVTAFILFC